MPQANQHWGYSSPHTWTKHYPVGKHQSPINILVGNYDQLIQSTCCNNNQDSISKNGSSHNKHHHHHHNNNNNHHHHHKHHNHHVINERMASLYLDPDNGATITESPPRVLEQKQRTHLDSVGDEQHPRSASTCSSASSGCPPSPAPNDDSDSDSASPNQVPRQQQQQVQKTRYCSSNHKIFLGYPRFLNSMQLCNTGHSWQVTLPGELASHTLVTGPPFGDREYRLAQLHCHWGENCQHGSEHLINGNSFAAEIHFVHWNCTDYSSMEEASKHKHGLAVLGVMIQALEGEHNRNKHLDKIANALKSIETPGCKVDVNARLDLKKLFPSNRWNYASYEGSLTTPPLSEVVDWVVFLNPIQCSTAQIEQFRLLKCPNETREAHERMIKNHRPVQPQHGRVVSIWTHH